MAASNHAFFASKAFATADSIVSPQEKHPGSSGNENTKPPHFPRFVLPSLHKLSLLIHA